MKVCPTCRTTYKDDDINFCLADGATLLKKKNGKPPFFARLGFLSHFDIAIQNFKFHLDAWRAKRSDTLPHISAARTWAEKRIGNREHSNAITPPAIAIGDFQEAAPILSDVEIAENERRQVINKDRDRIREIRDRIFELKGHVLDKVRSASSANDYVDIDLMDGLDFEHFVAELLNRRGFHAEVTKGSGDMGVDIIATNQNRRFAVQVKRYNQPISRRAISDAVTGKNFYDDCDGAMVITNNYFTKDAQTLAAASDCILVDRDELFNWMLSDTADIATFQARLRGEILNLQNPSTFAFWGSDVIFESSRELTVDYRLDFEEGSFKKFSEVNAWLDPESDPGYQLPQASLVTRNSGSGSFRALIESAEFQKGFSSTTVGFGESGNGSMVTANLDGLRHIFIAGSTDGANPAGLRTMLTSLLFKATPYNVAVVCFETRNCFLSSIEYHGIVMFQSYGAPSINEIDAIRVNHINKRYETLTKRGVKDFREYNLEAIRRTRCGQNSGDELWTEFRSIVVILYDFADTQAEIDEVLRDIVQRGSAVGIHLVLATLRPNPATVKRINWLGIPTRIVSHLPAPFDSRGILDSQPLSPNGQNEMLMRSAGSTDILSVFEPRLAYDFNAVLDHVRNQAFQPRSNVVEEDFGDLPGKRDPLFWDAVKSVAHAKRASTSLLRLHLRIGYGRAAAILDAMVKEGYIGDMEGSTRARPVLQKAYDDLQDIEEMKSA